MRPASALRILLLVSSVVSTILSGCIRGPEVGEEEGRCYPNDTCNEGLVCLSNTCVQLPEANDAGAAPEAEVASDAGPAPDARPLPPLSWAACDTSGWPSGYPPPPAGLECTKIEVPLDHARANGPSIALRVARHRAINPSGRAVFQLAGGPGGNSVAQSGMIPSYMPKLRDSFDLVYVDQRGTGGSGYMGCNGYPQTAAQWTACAAQYAGQDLDHYLTVDAAHDLELVRKRLGYGKVYLRGGSYGTRLALEMVRQHESSLAAVVLDGVDTPNWDFFSDTLRKADRGVNRLIDDCAKSTACKAVAPNLGADLTARRLLLRSSPRKILVGGQLTVEDEKTFLLDLKLFVEDSYWRFRVPRAVHAAVNGDNKLWNGLMAEVWGASVVDAKSSPGSQQIPPLRLRDASRRRRPDTLGPSYVAPGLYATVSCAEGLPNSPGLGALQALAAQQDWGALTAGSMLDVASACGSWKVAPLDASLRKPVVSPVKALLLAGEIDFITPPEVAAAALETLAGGTLLTVPNATHSTMQISCVGQIITDFIVAEGNIGSVSTSCLQKLPAPIW